MMLGESLTTLQARERDELLRAFRDVFNMPSGKRVLFWMLEQCAIYQDAYTGENNATNYTLGTQAAGRRLISKLDEVDPKFYPALLMAVADMKAMDRAAAARSTEKEDEENAAV